MRWIEAGFVTAVEDDIQSMNFILQREREDDVPLKLSSKIAPFPLSLFTAFHSTSVHVTLPPPIFTAATFFIPFVADELILILFMVRVLPEEREKRRLSE